MCKVYDCKMLLENIQNMTTQISTVGHDELPYTNTFCETETQLFMATTIKSDGIIQNVLPAFK